MTAGIEVRNDAGSYILTNNIKNPVIVQQGSVTTTTSTLQDGNGSIATVPSSGKIRTIRTAVAWHRLDATKFWVNAAVGTSIPYYNWDFPSDVYTTVGIEMYADAAGLPIVFSTNTTHKPMRVVYNRDLRPSNVFYAESEVLNTDFVPNAAKDYAMTHGVWSGKRQWDSGALNTGTGFADESYWAQRVYATQVRLGSSGLYYAYHCINDDIASFIGDGPHSTPPTSPPNTKEDALQLLVLDVTGY